MIRAASVVGPRLHRLAPALAPRRRPLRASLFAAGTLLGLVALLDPAWGEAGEAPEPRGADVVLCLDVSRSMLARDEDPSRLDRAKREIADLAREARGDRLALVAFAGEARLLVPLTGDIDTLVELARGADPLSVAKGGTDLGAALDTARAALDAAGGDRGTIVILTDGEDLGGRGLRAAQTCGRRGIAVHCVGFGTARGSRIAVEGARGEEYQRDRAGREVLSAADPAALRAIASAAGGESAVGSLADLYRRRILPESRRALGVADRPARPHRFQWPLLAAFALWILSWCPPPAPRS